METTKPSWFSALATRLLGKSANYLPIVKGSFLIPTLLTFSATGSPTASLIKGTSCALGTITFFRVKQTLADSTQKDSVLKKSLCACAALVGAGAIALINQRGMEKLVQFGQKAIESL